ncbi:hypothetical protein [Paraburkholderia sp. BL6669N2]|uniref:hypothetical protein n=1 Tax=Paraburkholderia sp. BL6669N2 TaxID=1938807 RepID=UPI0028687CA2|nr:hypothetical protein [Paraburkholderia sp. BL6669N2]
MLLIRSPFVFLKTKHIFLQHPIGGRQRLGIRCRVSRRCRSGIAALHIRIERHQHDKRSAGKPGCQNYFHPFTYRHFLF